MFSFLRKDKTRKIQLRVDMHSHLIPGIDDGVKSLDESISLIREFHELGYERVITTPHIMGDFYKNTPEIINKGLDEVRKRIEQENIPVKIEAAAEYYLDEFFIQDIESKKKLMTFGDNLILFELPYLNRPIQLEQTIFNLLSSGYKPILAHPERYQYFQGKEEKLREIKEKGLYFQINLNSLTGYYSKGAKKTAEYLIKNEMVEFLGSDAHNLNHLKILDESLRSGLLSKIPEETILNNQI